MSRIRMPVVAGMFYPADPGELGQLVDQLLAQAAAAPPGDPPTALIAPHAGYPYSGPIAASGYLRLQAVADRIRRVVLLGPSHRVPFTGLAMTQAERYGSPLGEVILDRATLNVLSRLPQVKILDPAHAFEHSLEVQLPFLQRVLRDFTLVPLVVGEASPQAVAQVLDAVQADDTLIIVSSDLSHYHDYATAQKLDQQASQAIAALRHEDLAPEQACGHHPIAGLLQHARQRGLRCEIVDMRNSGDTAGDKAQVVGYGTYAFY